MNGRKAGYVASVRVWSGEDASHSGEEMLCTKGSRGHQNACTRAFTNATPPET